MATAIEQVQVAPVNMKERQELGIKPGDTVKVHQKIQDKGKTRIQIFDGLVLATKHGHEAGATFTVRKVASGVGVEKIFPLYSPLIDKIEIVKRAKVRRAKLYYIREKVARQIKRQMRRMSLVSMGTESEISAANRRAEEEAKAAEEAAAKEAEAAEAEATPAEDAATDTATTKAEATEATEESAPVEAEATETTTEIDTKEEGADAAETTDAAESEEPVAESDDDADAEKKA